VRAACAAAITNDPDIAVVVVNLLLAIEPTDLLQLDR
jgi:hypothetical protein